MKFSCKAIALTLVMAGMLMGCGTRERFMIKQDGLWDMTSLQTTVYVNDTFVSDTTVTDSLGQMQFSKEGGGQWIDAAGNKDDFTWSLNHKDDTLTIYSQVKEFINAGITNRSDNSLTFRWLYLHDEYLERFREEKTAKIQRVGE
jgi:hypothetical protein